MANHSFIEHILTELLGKTSNWQQIINKQVLLFIHHRMYVAFKIVSFEKRKLLGHNNSL